MPSTLSGVGKKYTVTLAASVTIILIIIHCVCVYRCEWQGKG